MDLEKLSQAPWTAWSMNAPPSQSPYGPYGRVIGPRFFFVDHSECLAPDDAEFIALARNAFEVMMRRGWGVEWNADGWTVTGLNWSGPETAADPFTALVEADKWYRENVEKKDAAT